MESTLARYDFYRAILTGKTCSADDDHLGQNDRELKLHTLINFVGMTVFNNNGVPS